LGKVEMLSTKSAMKVVAVSKLWKPFPEQKKRVITVVGLHASLAKALHLMADRLHDQKKKGATATAVTVSEASEYTITLLIPNTQVGGIIGKNGAKINNTRTSCGCHIKISEKPLEDSTEKAVVPRGTSKAVGAALKQMCYQLTEVCDKTARIPYIPRPEYDPYTYPPSHYDPVPPPSQYGGYHSYPLQQSKIPASSQTLVIPVPEHLMGTVIGKGGQSINEIRGRSGAHVKIAELESGATDRIITITGTPQANEVAVAMIHQKTAEWSGPS